MRELGVNTIRISGSDPTSNHDQCMKLLADAGIYVMVDIISSDEVFAIALLLARHTW